MSKLMETNELMLAIEKMVIKELQASIIGHEQAMEGSCKAEFYAIIDGKKYTINIEQDEDENV